MPHDTSLLANHQPMYPSSRPAGGRINSSQPHCCVQSSPPARAAPHLLPRRRFSRNTADQLGAQKRSSSVPLIPSPPADGQRPHDLRSNDRKPLAVFQRSSPGALAITTHFSVYRKAAIAPPPPPLPACGTVYHSAPSSSKYVRR